MWAVQVFYKRLITVYELRIHVEHCQGARVEAVPLSVGEGMGCLKNVKKKMKIL